MKPGPKAKPFWSHVKTGDCWEWQGSMFGNGYGRTFVDRKGVGAHRRAYELFYGAIPEGSFVCHRCDNKRCVRPSHLFLGTPKDNLSDMVAKGRSLTGERNHNAKLTHVAVADIRESYAAGGVTQADLAARHNVTEPAVWNVLHDRNWAA